jgi:hypothetical protein
VAFDGESLQVSWQAPQYDGGDAVVKYKVEWDPSPLFDSALAGDESRAIAWAEIFVLPGQRFFVYEIARLPQAGILFNGTSALQTRARIAILCSHFCIQLC